MVLGSWSLVRLWSFVLLSATIASAQDRPFLFSVTTAAPGTPVLRIDYDVGAGERAFQSGTENQPEQRVAVQAARGRFTLLGRVGLVSDGSAYQSSQAGELLVSVLDRSRSRMTLAGGGGVLHEANGTNVLLARAVAGRETDAWRLHGNVLLQKPLASDRDAVDLISTIGWAWKVSPAVSLGAEGVAEDLEGFWDPLEAEGGARILVGPSVHIAPRGRQWQFTATGGPAFHPSDTGRTSAALRDLPATRARVGYAVKAGLTYRLF